MRELSKLTEFTEEQREAFAAALERYGSNDDVTGVDIGYKYKGGEKTGTVGIRIHVKEKKAPDVLLRERVEPFDKSINDVPVDVIEAVYEPSGSVPVTLDQRKTRLNVIQPGISVGHHLGSTGTIGLIVKDDKNNGQPAILSNWHILCRGNNARPGEEIIQPSPNDGGSMPGDQVALLERMVINTEGDAAIALLDRSNGRGWDEAQYGTGVKLTGFCNPQLGEILEKSGRTTGVTHGQVDGVGRFFLDYPIGRVGIDGFKLVAPTPRNHGNARISASGDSGCIWYNPYTKEGVGLHFAGEKNSSSQSENAIACFLPRVLGALNVSINLESPGSLIEVGNRFNDPARHINVNVCEFTPTSRDLPPIEQNNKKEIDINGNSIEISVDTTPAPLGKDYWIKMHQVASYKLTLNGNVVIKNVTRSGYDTMINISKGYPGWKLRVNFPAGIYPQQTKNVTVGDG